MISSGQAHFAKVRLEYVPVCRVTVLSELFFESSQVYNRQQLHKRICEVSLCDVVDILVSRRPHTREVALNISEMPVGDSNSTNRLDSHLIL